MTDSQTAPNLSPPDSIEAPALPSTGVRELDDIAAALMRMWVGHLDAAIDEVYGALAHVYPGLYADPDAEKIDRVEFRVHETTGQIRLVSGANAWRAHTAGLRVERRIVSESKWEVEPNPNNYTREPVVPPPAMVSEHPEHPAAYSPELATAVSA